MVFIWDYNIDELEKTESGKALLLERTLNYGPEKGELIDLLMVKKYWRKMNLFPKTKRLMELLIWGKIQSSTKNKK